MRVGSLVAVTLMLLAGCLGAPGGTSPQPGTDEPGARDLPPIDFARALDVETTPTEPEYRGFLRVAWAADAFAIDSQNEPDLAHFTLVFPDRAYGSSSGMGWIEYDLTQGLEAGTLSNRLVLWDLRALLQDPSVAVTRSGSGGEVVVHGAGESSTADSGYRLNFTLSVRDGAIAYAHLTSPHGRESPFKFTPSNETLRFPLVRPTHVLGEEQVRDGDSVAYSGHVHILQMIGSYCTTHAGQVPPRVDAETLRIELLASGKPWPIGAYDATPVHAEETSGNFLWDRTSDLTGRYVGYGWDGLLVSKTFGATTCRA